MNKKFVEIVIFLVVSTMIIPVAGIISTQADDGQNRSLNLNNFNENSLENEWWPMFRQNSGNTGSSVSIGPITNHIKWKHKIPENLYATTPIVYDDKLFVSTNWYYYSENTNITKLNLLEKPPSIPDVREILINHLSEDPKGLYCLDAITGEQLWFRSFYAPNDPAIANGNLYIVDIDSSYMSKLYCLNPTTGDVIWEKTIAQMVLSPTIIANDKIYLSGFENDGYSSSINCYDISGNFKWTYPLPVNEITWFSAPAVDDGIVSFISTNIYSYFEGRIYGLNAENGGYLWSQPIFSLFFFYFGMPSAVCKDGKVYAVDFNIYNYLGYLKCFDAKTGSPLWTTNLGTALSWSTPAVDGDFVFVSGVELYSYNNWLYRVYSSNGTIQWMVFIPGVSYFSGSTPICSTNTIILSQSSYYGESNEILCFNKDDGMSLWQLYLDDITIGAPSIGDQKVYIVDYSGNVYAIEDVLKVKKVSGGLMNVKMLIQNTGNTSLTNISWTLSVKGGAKGFIDSYRFGSIETLKAGKSRIVLAFPIFGMGKVYINATLTMEEMNVLQIKKEGSVFGPIIIVNS